MIPFPQPKRFAERGSGLLAGASDVTRSTDPFSLLAARHGTRLPFSLRAGLLFSLAGIGSLSEPTRPFAVAVSLLPPECCIQIRRVPGCNSVVVELIELRGKDGLDRLGIRCGELVLERQYPLRPDCQSVQLASYDERLVAAARLLGIEAWDRTRAPGTA